MDGAARGALPGWHRVPVLPQPPIAALERELWCSLAGVNQCGRQGGAAPESCPGWRGSRWHWRRALPRSCADLCKQRVRSAAGMGKGCALVVSGLSSCVCRLRFACCAAGLAWATALSAPGLAWLALPPPMPHMPHPLPTQRPSLPPPSAHRLALPLNFLFMAHLVSHASETCTGDALSAPASQRLTHAIFSVMDFTHQALAPPGWAAVRVAPAAECAAVLIVVQVRLGGSGHIVGWRTSRAEACIAAC